MKVPSRFLLLASLLIALVGLGGCDTDTTSGSSGSSESASVNLRPKTHNPSDASSCGVQTATQYQAADVRYAQYEECMYTYAGSFTT